jgi:hypothetical protein
MPQKQVSKAKKPVAQPKETTTDKPKRSQRLHAKKKDSEVVVQPTKQKTPSPARSSPSPSPVRSLPPSPSPVRSSPLQSPQIHPSSPTVINVEEDSITYSLVENTMTQIGGISASPNYSLQVKVTGYLVDTAHTLIAEHIYSTFNVKINVEPEPRWVDKNCTHVVQVANETDWNTLITHRQWTDPIDQVHYNFTNSARAEDWCFIWPDTAQSPGADQVAIHLYKAGFSIVGYRSVGPNTITDHTNETDLAKVKSVLNIRGIDIKDASYYPNVAAHEREADRQVVMTCTSIKLYDKSLLKVISDRTVLITGHPPLFSRSVVPLNKDRACVFILLRSAADVTKVVNQGPWRIQAKNGTKTTVHNINVERVTPRKKRNTGYVHSVVVNQSHCELELLRMQNKVLMDRLNTLQANLPQDKPMAVQPQRLTTTNSATGPSKKRARRDVEEVEDEDLVDQDKIDKILSDE